MITKPQNVYVMRDILCTGYVAGGNCQFFGGDRANNAKNSSTGIYNLEAIRNAMNERLAFTDDASGDYASMLAFVAPYKEVTAGHRDQVISISERLLPWEVTRHTALAEKEHFPGGQANFDIYKTAYALDQLHFGEDVRAAENMEFISQGSVNNALCFVGPHRRYNPFSANFFELVPGQGHFGPDAIPGVRARPAPRPVRPRAHPALHAQDARWRRGESVSLNAARNSMVSLEVAAHSQLALRPANQLP